MKPWQPDSWQNAPLSQQIRYRDTAKLAKVTAELRELPPLVSVAEIESLEQQLADAALGKRFLLQGGDCAKSFADCNAAVIRRKLRILMQMSLLLVRELNCPVIRVGRIAGQYAKPRSAQEETRETRTLPSYRGDLVNHAGFTEAGRTPDPERLLQGYGYASLTLNYLRALLEGDWRAVVQLTDDEIAQLPDAIIAPLSQLTGQLEESLHLTGQFAPQQATPQRLEMFTSHEALHLHYEQALTRQSKDGRWFNLSTHFPWIGMRTTHLESAHIEYCRGIANPIGLKVGPELDAEHLVTMCRLINPDNRPGRVTLINRFGYQHVQRYLPKMITAVERAQLAVLWVSDPMHGNTRVTSAGIKTRDFDHINSELEASVAIHQRAGTHLGGVHFEMTGEHVTECTGGIDGITEADLPTAYKSLVDPRLNARQAHEMAQRLGHLRASSKCELVTDRTLRLR